MPLQLLERNAAEHPNELAIVDGRARINHKDLLDRVESLAHGLSAQGIGRRDRVALFLANSADYIVSFYAIAACRKPSNRSPRALPFLIPRIIWSCSIPSSKPSSHHWTT